MPATGAQQRRSQALQAARDVADALGVVATRARILKDSNNTIVHLAPAPLVAKVETSHFRDAELESLERELAVGRFLAERDAPVIAPARMIAPGPHRRRDLTVTLWEYAEPVPSAVLDSADAARGLAAVHAALRDFPDPLPPFDLELEDASRLLERDRSPALAAGDRAFLHSAVDELRAALSGMAKPMQPLHGSPHAGNWLRTADGWLLLDFETACRGPIEWDLTVLDEATVERFDGVDSALIDLLRRMRSVCVAVKCWVEPSRAPEVREAAQVHLKLLRGEPLRPPSRP